MLIDTCAIAQRDRSRAEIDQAVAVFLASGKTIRQIAAGAQTFPTPEEKQMAKGRGRAAKKRVPARKPSHRKHSGEDLAAFARRMLEGGFV